MVRRVLSELVVSDLGVIDDISLVLGPGMTALTGETGAGKTLLIEAIQLLLGGRADPSLVRAGAAEARVDGRFALDEGEVVLSRVVPAEGRSRAYVDGRPVPLHVLAVAGRGFVDLHGQHAHQSLLEPVAQRQALDDFADVDYGDLTASRELVLELSRRLTGMGGDERARAREIDLLRFQLCEIDAAAITADDEDLALERDEDILADATAYREAAASAFEAMTGDSGARTGLATALTLLRDRRPFDAVRDRVGSVLAELDDVAAELRMGLDSIEEDPVRLAAIRARRSVLRDLRRKYGPDLVAVLEFRDEARLRLCELETHDETARQLEAALSVALEGRRSAASEVRRCRAEAAPRLAKLIERGLRDLAMPHAVVDIAVGDAIDGDPGSVVFLLGANRGDPPQPMTKVASGGELSRVMLATSLALMSSRRDDPHTLVFDEVDAGVGGAAARAVGEALAALGSKRQVLVVTHLPQVAAVADAQVLVAKTVHRQRTRTSTVRLHGDDRVRELSRMLSGQPDSETAKRHAEELLAERVPGARSAGRRRTSRADAKPD